MRRELRIHRVDGKCVAFTKLDSSEIRRIKKSTFTSGAKGAKARNMV